MLPVAALLHEALPRLSPCSRSIINHLVAVLGYFGHASSVATAVGLQSRYQVAHTLQNDYLPCLEELAAWVRLLGWIHEWEMNRTTICGTTLSCGRDPAVCYRSVRRITGCCWTEVKERGSNWVVGQLQARCRERRQHLSQERSLLV